MCGRPRSPLAMIGVDRTSKRDLDRQAFLTAAGWTVLRFRAADVLHRPRVVAAAIRRALAARGVIAANRTAAPR